MTLQEFLHETQSEVRSQMNDGSPFAELVFSEIIMSHMSDIGMTYEPVLCHFQGKVQNAILRLTGYSLSEDGDQLDLFVSLYRGVDDLTPVSDSDAKTAVSQCVKFLQLCAEGKLAAKVDPSSDVYSLALTIREIYNELEQVRVYVLTDCVAKSKSFQTRDIGGKSVRLEVMDIERLFRHQSEGKPRDELLVNFLEVSGTPLPCVYVPGANDEYDYALTAIPGEALRFIYEKFGSRLLEANVRSFLSVKGKGVNAGIQNSLRSNPERFMAYNNGIVLVADEAKLERSADGSPGIVWLKGMQIVNGGQTTASIYFTKKKFPDVDLSHVRVPAKIIVMKEEDPAKEEALVSDISRYANTQNAVRQSDLSANKPFHVDIERLSLTVYCPDGTGRWFYERAAGSYNTMLAREGSTPAKLRALKDAVPASRKITKTDLAKYLMSWSGKADIVSLGAQKCFDRFMSSMNSEDGSELVYQSPDVQFYKTAVAKALLFKAANKVARPLVPAFLANITAYTIGLMAKMFGDSFDFDKVWQKQGISQQLSEQIATWTVEINARLHETARGRMISEWAKKPECIDAVYSHRYSQARDDIPEIKKG